MKASERHGLGSKTLPLLKLTALTAWVEEALNVL